jgi:hypothetical protein
MDRRARAVQTSEESRTTAARSQPRDGDIVVTRESKSGAAFTIRQVPGVVQFSAFVRDEAIRLARGFARENNVDLWYCEDGTYRLLEAYRGSEGHDER